MIWLNKDILKPEFEDPTSGLCGREAEGKAEGGRVPLSVFPLAGALLSSPLFGVSYISCEEFGRKVSDGALFSGLCFPAGK